MYTPHRHARGSTGTDRTAHTARVDEPDRHTAHAHLCSLAAQSKRRCSGCRPTRNRIVTSLSPACAPCASPCACVRAASELHQIDWLRWVQETDDRNSRCAARPGGAPKFGARRQARARARGPPASSLAHRARIASRASKRAPRGRRELDIELLVVWQQLVRE